MTDNLIDVLPLLLNTAKPETLREVRKRIDMLNQEVRLYEHIEGVLMQKFPQEREQILVRKAYTSTPILAERVRNAILGYLKNGPAVLHAMYKELSLSQGDKAVANTVVNDGELFIRNGPAGRSIELTEQGKRLAVELNGACHESG